MKQEPIRFLINLLISYRKKKKIKKKIDKAKQNNFTWLTQPGKKRKRNIQEKLSKTNELILSLFFYYFFYFNFPGSMEILASIRL